MLQAYQFGQNYGVTTRAFKGLIAIVQQWKEEKEATKALNVLLKIAEINSTVLKSLRAITVNKQMPKAILQKLADIGNVSAIRLIFPNKC